MSIQRTITLDNITPSELAVLFCAYDGEQQAEFFHELHTITKTWAGAGWCQQCCSISEHLTVRGKEVIAKLAEWAADPYVSASA